MSVSLSELLAEYGDDNLKFQMLSRVLDGGQRALKDGGTRFSFASDCDLTEFMRGEHEAFVVWMDRLAMEAAIRRVQERKRGTPTSGASDEPKP